MTPRVAVLAVALAAGGCVSARDCALAIPQAQRADAIRFAIDRNFVEEDIVPRDDMSLALGAGRPYADLTDEERTQLARHAAGYGACIRDRVTRDRR